MKHLIEDILALACVLALSAGLPFVLWALAG